VTDDQGAGLRFDCAEGMEFSALPWTPFEIENAGHPGELPPIEHTVLRPALMRRGVGGDDSWGALTHPEFRVPQGSELVFRFGFQGVR
jgi:beta-galactosidase